MEELIRAIEVIKKYNDLDFDILIEIMRKEERTKITDEQIEEFRYMGLNNVDFFKMYGDIK